MTSEHWRIDWTLSPAHLAAFEPNSAEVELHAATLAGWYNEGYNRSMMDNSRRMTAADVIDQFRLMREEGGRPFVLHLDGSLAGDADFRRVRGDTAEFAIMVGARSLQGKGLGTRFSVILHTFAFRMMGLDRVYLSIVPANEPGRRCYEKVGYVLDSSDQARGCADSDSDITMSLARDEFERRHAQVLGQIRLERRCVDLVP